MARTQKQEETYEEPATEEPQPEEQSLNIEVDLDDIDQPYAVLPDGQHDITLADAKLKMSSGGHPMLETRYQAPHPESGEMCFMRDYPLLDRQDGKFRVKQLLIAAGLPTQINPDNIAALVSAHPTVPAMIEVEVSEEYGEQNRVRRLLVEVPKVQR